MSLNACSFLFDRSFEKIGLGVSVNITISYFAQEPVGSLTELSFWIYRVATLENLLAYGRE